MFMSVFTQKKACIGETLEPSKNTTHENVFDSGMPWIRREEKEATSLGGQFQRPERDRRLGKMSSKRADAWSASDAALGLSSESVVVVVGNYRVAVGFTR
jgi:hypothetical protein